MKKTLLTFFLTLTLLGLTTNALAQTAKIITLKDGSILKGKVLQLNNGIYTIETSNLGHVDIPESDVLSITAPEASSLPAAQAGNTTMQAGQLQAQVQEIQGSILSDPGLMTELQSLLDDKEIQEMLSDPKLLNDVMSYDPEKIQQNPDVQNLMKNPKMLELMNKIQQKIPAP